MARIIDALKRRFKSIGTKVSKYQEAITFAEAGETEYALEVMSDQKEYKGQVKLLVMGNGSDFSRNMIDYALEMAERMSYGIVALNSAPLSCETFKAFSSPRKQICNEFENMSMKNVAVFQKEAVEKDIPFDHVVMFDDLDTATKNVMNRNNITFVISESIEDREEDRAENGSRLNNNLYVYSMV